MADLVRLGDLISHRNHPGEWPIVLNGIARQNIMFLLNNIDLKYGETKGKQMMMKQITTCSP